MSIVQPHPPTIPSMAAAWTRFTVALLAATGTVAAATVPQGSEPLACVPAKSDDPAPWTWNARVLASFRPDTPRPEFAGAFGDDRSQHELHLWRDSAGIFGELLSPVLDADSPTSRLYNPHLDPRTRAFDFVARFSDGERRFEGALRSDSIVGTLHSSGRSERIRWRKLRATRVHGAGGDFYASRAQFECAMILFRR